MHHMGGLQGAVSSYMVVSMVLILTTVAVALDHVLNLLHD